MRERQWNEERRMSLLQAGSKSRRPAFPREISASRRRMRMAKSRTDIAPSRLLLFDVLDRLFDRCDKGLRLSQGALRQLKFRNQHTRIVDNDQSITLFHNDTPA